MKVNTFSRFMISFIPKIDRCYLVTGIFHDNKFDLRESELKQNEKLSVMSLDKIVFNLNVIR